MNENINTNSYIDKFTLNPVSSLFFAIGFLAIGYGMILTYVGVYLKDLGLNDAVIGLINASFFLGAIGSSIFIQKIIRLRSNSLRMQLFYKTFGNLFRFIKVFDAMLHKHAAGFFNLNGVVFASWVKAHATNSGFIVRAFTGIANVITSARLPKIADAVVRSVSVYVVNVTDRPFAIVIKPCKSVRPEESTVYA